MHLNIEDRICIMYDNITDIMLFDEVMVIFEVRDNGQVKQHELEFNTNIATLAFHFLLESHILNNEPLNIYKEGLTAYESE